MNVGILPILVSEAANASPHMWLSAMKDDSTKNLLHAEGDHDDHLLGNSKIYDRLLSRLVLQKVRKSGTRRCCC